MPRKRNNEARSRRDEKPADADGAMTALTVRIPEEHELIPALQDTYHGLFIGPCSDAEAAAEIGCPLIEQIGTVPDDDFDCKYSRWAELFREEVYFDCIRHFR
jgi:hypothetical protein